MCRPLSETLGYLLETLLADWLETSGQMKYYKYWLNRRRFDLGTFQWFSKKLGFWVFAKQPTVHSGGVSRGRVHGCGCWRYWQVKGDWWHVTCDMWHMTHDRWHVTCETLGMTHDIVFLFFFLFFHLAQLSATATGTCARLTKDRL